MKRAIAHIHSVQSCFFERFLTFSAKWHRNFHRLGNIVQSRNHVETASVLLQSHGISGWLRSRRIDFWGNFISSNKGDHCVSFHFLPFQSILFKKNGLFSAIYFTDDSVSEIRNWDYQFAPRKIELVLNPKTAGCSWFSIEHPLEANHLTPSWELTYPFPKQRSLYYQPKQGTVKGKSFKHTIDLLHCLISPNMAMSYQPLQNTFEDCLVGGFFPPIWKICSSKWVHLPQGLGWKSKKYLKPPASFFSKCGIGWFLGGYLEDHPRTCKWLITMVKSPK